MKTNNFKSFLSSQLNGYIQYRKNLGFEDYSLGTALNYLDQSLPAKGNTTILDPSFFIEFKKTLNIAPRTINKTVRYIKGFFDYMIRIDQITQNPLTDIPPSKEDNFIPFIFSPEETQKLLCAASANIRQEQQHFITDLMTYTSILLLSSCGMRISEPLKLQLKHYREKEGTLYIEKTKFKKDRLIPVPWPICKELSK